MDPAFSCDFCGGYMGDEDKKPLVLHCGDTFCAQCICELFREGKYKCPTCSCQHNSKNINSIPVNYTLLEIIKAERYSSDKNDKDLKIFTALSKKDNLNHHNAENKSQIILPDYKIENDQPFKAPLPHAGRCDNHDVYCKSWCKSCREWICHDCTVIGHPPLQCEIRPFDQALGELKLEGDLCIKKTIKLFDNQAEKYCEKHLALKGKREKNRALMKELQTLITKHQKAKSDVERQTEAIKSCLADGLSTLLTILKSQGQLLEAQTLEEVISARYRAQFCQSKILDWHVPTIMLLSEEISYSEELQKSTFTTLAVLRDFFSSDDSTTELKTSGLTTLSLKDEKVVARNLKYLLETSPWKKIISEKENNYVTPDDAMHCSLDRSRRTCVRQCDLEKRNHKAYAVENEQMKANPLTSGKFEVSGENLIDLNTEERGFSGRCSFPCMEYLTCGDSKQLEYPSKHTELVAKGEIPLSPHVGKIFGCEESLENLSWKPAGREEEEKENRKQLWKYTVAQEDDDSTRLLAEGTAFWEHSSENLVKPLKRPSRCQEIYYANDWMKKGDHSGAVYETYNRQMINRGGLNEVGITHIRDRYEKTSELLSAVREDALTDTDREESINVNSLSKNSKNELHLFHESFDYDVHQSKTRKKRGDPGNIRFSNSASEVIRTVSGEVVSPLCGEVGSSVSGETSGSLSGRKYISASGDSNIVSGKVIVVAGDADEDDDDDDNLSTKEDVCDIMPLLESKEIERALERTEWKYETRGIFFQEGGESPNGEKLIQDGNKEQTGAAIWGYKGLVSGKSNETSSDPILVSVCEDRNYSHTDRENKTELSGYQGDGFIPTDSYFREEKKAQTERGCNDDNIFPPESEFGVKHFPVSSKEGQEDKSEGNAHEEAREIETALGIERDTTFSSGDLDESERNDRCVISELYENKEAKITDADEIEENNENTVIGSNKSKIREKCRVM